MIFSILKKYIWLINILLLVAIAYVVASMISDRIQNKLDTSNQVEIENTAFKDRYKEIKDFKNSRNYYELIEKRNLFGLDMNTLASGSSDTTAPKTSLNLELLGTYLAVSGKSIAIIKNLDNGRVSGFSDGDDVDIITSENVTMKQVGNCKAVISREFRGSESILCKKDLAFAKAATSTQRNREPVNTVSDNVNAADGIKKLDSGVYQIDKNMLDELLEDPTDLLNQARVIPQDDGLRFFGIRPSSIFFKIGLRNGDTIHSINEVALSDVQNALSIFTSLKDQTEFTIDFTRRGKKQSNSYSVN